MLQFNWFQIKQPGRRNRRRESLESIVLELEYLADHAPETGAERVALVRQEPRDAVAAAPLASAAAVQLRAHREGHVRYLHLHPELFKPLHHVWVSYLHAITCLCHIITVFDLSVAVAKHGTTLLEFFLVLASVFQENARLLETSLLLGSRQLRSREPLGPARRETRWLKHDVTRTKGRQA